MIRTNHPTQAEMHEQHLVWRQERAAWLDDIEIWRTQEARALAELARLEAAIREHGAALLEHGRGVRALAAEEGGHERELHELQEAGLGDQYDPQSHLHQEWARKHEQARAAHERIKGYHHDLLAELGRLARQVNVPI